MRCREEETVGWRWGREGAPRPPASPGGPSGRTGVTGGGVEGHRLTPGPGHTCAQQAFNWGPQHRGHVARHAAFKKGWHMVLTLEAE